MRGNGVVGVVMAGGASSRMGSDKSELSISGQSLTQCAINTLLDAGLHKVVISSGNKSPGITDLIANKGPLGGMHAVMQHIGEIDASGFVFLPVDMPMVTVELVKLLVKSGSANTSPYYFKNWPMPCYLPNTAAVVQTLDLALSENKLAVNYLLKTLNASELIAQEFNQDVFTNINTPEQWSNYKQLSKTNIE